MADFNPYQTPNAYVEDVSDGVDGELAGRWTRFGAGILDSLIFAIPVALMMFGIAMFNKQSGGSGELVAGVIIAIAIGVVAILVLLGINFVMLSRSGQTLGKRLLSVKIVRTDGSRVGLARIIFLRALLTGAIGSIPFVGPVFSLADALFIFRDSRRTIHDLIADTIVIRA